MIPADLHQRVGRWMSGVGPDNDVVISSRVRLARNAAGHRFMTRASVDERRELAAQLAAAITAAGDPVLRYIDLEPLSAVDRHMLVERHLISREHADAEGPRGVGLSNDEAVSIMVNEEDHLRMQVLHGGLDLQTAWAQMVAIDEAIQRRVPYAFDETYGYLTACPTNVGTGLRVSVMVHLPALAMTRELQRVFNAAAKIDFVVRGLYGEGTQGHGDFFQISNQKSLGRSEKEIIDNLEIVIPKIVSYERKVRQDILTEHRRQVEDRIFRARGILRGARLMTSEEALHLISQLRLGVQLGMIREVDTPALHRLFILSRPAHLQRWYGRELDGPERDAARADFLRKALGAE